VVDLIDRLAFAGVLERFIKCPVCGRWMYASNPRRDYCSDKCRYSVWMKTPKGLEKRRRASAVWRKRFSEEILKATPNVRRRKRTK
jgi:predicted nucleic acid-binding Zn ribbon protein